MTLSYRRTVQGKQQLGNCQYLQSFQSGRPWAQLANRSESPWFAVVDEKVERLFRISSAPSRLRSFPRPVKAASQAVGEHHLQDVPQKAFDLAGPVHFRTSPKYRLNYEQSKK